MTKLHHLTGEFESGRVRLDGQELTPHRSLAVRNHSPTGFSWGYTGSGPAQLALAVLLEVAPAVAEAKHQQFKDDFVARLPEADFDRTFRVDEEGKLA